jgi:hypothetical protein
MVMKELYYQCHVSFWDFLIFFMMMEEWKNTRDIKTSIYNFYKGNHMKHDL